MRGENQKRCCCSWLADLANGHWEVRIAEGQHTRLGWTRPKPQGYGHSVAIVVNYDIAHFPNVSSDLDCVAIL